MKDITTILENVLDRDTDWQHSLFYSFTESLNNLDFDVSFWEGEENWATVIYNTQAVGYVWKKYPLIFLTKETSTSIKDLRKDFEEITILEVDKLNVDLFKLKNSGTIDYFGENLDFDSFTAEDLWFATNSK